MKIICICGPSGSGKTTVIQSLLNLYPSRYELFKTVTDRDKREAEEKTNYIFVTPEKFDQMITADDFLEYETQPHNNKRYGKAKSVLNSIDKNKIVLTELRINKVEEFKHNLLSDNVFSIFLIIEDIEKMKSRLLRRGDSEETVKKRIFLMEADEIVNKDLADYIVPSHEGKIDKTVHQINKIATTI